MDRPVVKSIHLAPGSCGLMTPVDPILAEAGNGSRWTAAPGVRAGS